MCQDTDGGIWTCRWQAGKVIRLTEGGEVDAIIDFPTAWHMTCCIFGGENDYRSDLSSLRQLSDCILGQVTTTTSSMSLRLRQITTARCFLTGSTAAASLWSRVWGSLVLRGGGLAGRWRICRRHWVAQIPIPSFACVALYEGSLFQLIVTPVRSQVVARRLCVRKPTVVQGDSSVEKSRDKSSRAVSLRKSDTDAAYTTQVWET